MPKILVVGCGLTGAATYHFLTSANPYLRSSLEIWESNDQIGGRMSTDHHKGLFSSCDLGAQYITEEGGDDYDWPVKYNDNTTTGSGYIDIFDMLKSNGMLTPIVDNNIVEGMRHDEQTKTHYIAPLGTASLIGKLTTGAKVRMGRMVTDIRYDPKRKKLQASSRSRNQGRSNLISHSPSQQRTSPITTTFTQDSLEPTRQLSGTTVDIISSDADSKIRSDANSDTNSDTNSSTNSDIDSNTRSDTDSDTGGDPVPSSRRDEQFRNQNKQTRRGIAPVDTSQELVSRHGRLATLSILAPTGERLGFYPTKSISDTSTSDGASKFMSKFTSRLSASFMGIENSSSNSNSRESVGTLILKGLNNVLNRNKMDRNKRTILGGNRDKQLGISNEGTGGTGTHIWVKRVSRDGLNHAPPAPHMQLLSVTGAATAAPAKTSGGISDNDAGNEDLFQHSHRDHSNRSGGNSDYSYEGSDTSSVYNVNGVHRGVGYSDCGGIEEVDYFDAIVLTAPAPQVLRIGGDFLESMQPPQSQLLLLGNDAALHRSSSGSSSGNFSKERSHPNPASTGISPDLYRNRPNASAEAITSVASDTGAIPALHSIYDRSRAVEGGADDSVQVMTGHVSMSSFDKIEGGLRGALASVNYSSR